MRTTLNARRSMLALVLAVAATAVMSACSNPTAPTSTSTVGVRHSGYIVASSRSDSTDSNGQ